MKKVLLLAGGQSSEYDISLISQSFLKKHLESFENIDLHTIIFPKDNPLKENISFKDYDYIIPCFHGYPGETGDIQSLFKIYNLSYLGSPAQAHQACFNKVTTKLYLNALGIPNTPFIHGQRLDSEFEEKALSFFNRFSKKGVFVKAARQGSSIGCLPAHSKKELSLAIKKCFHYDSYLLIEKTLKARELEVAAFEYQGKLHITPPGEVIAPNDNFYSYEEKYSSQSHSQTKVKAHISKEVLELITNYSKKIFQHLELKDLARIDFFLTENQEIYLNEINTFPGLTPISMFPQMMEAYGVSFGDYLQDRIFNSL